MACRDLIPKEEQVSKTARLTHLGSRAQQRGLPRQCSEPATEHIDSRLTNIILPRPSHRIKKVASPSAPLAGDDKWTTAQTITRPKTPTNHNVGVTRLVGSWLEAAALFAQCEDYERPWQWGALGHWTLQAQHWYYDSPKQQIDMALR